MQPQPTHNNSGKIKHVRRRAARWLLRLLFRAQGGGARLSAHVPRAGVHRILIVRSAKTLGETLLLTPLLREIEVLYPGAEIDVISRCGAAGHLFANWFQIRGVLPLPNGRSPWQLLRAIRRVRAEVYDLAIDPYILSHSDRSLVRLARARYKIGFDGPRKSGHLSHPVIEPATLQHAGKLPVYLLRESTGAGGDSARQDYPSLDIRLNTSERRAGAMALAAVLSGHPAHGVIGVFAYATGAKRFDSAWWERFLPVIEACFPHHALVEIVPMFGKSLLGDRYPTYYSSDVRKLGAVLGELALFISADCGVMHLAAASGAPTAGIFSVTDIPGWSVYGQSCNTFDARGREPEEIANAVADRYIA